VIPESYDIFSGSPQGEPVWLESVDGLDAASQRMHERANQMPGRYFVDCVHTNEVIASVDTSAHPEQPSSEPAGAPRRFAQTA
jgi:hypothetical protein